MKSRKNTNKDILNEKLNYLIEQLKKATKDNFAGVLSSVISDTYSSQGFKQPITQYLINIDTLLRSDPISVMSYVGNNNMFVDEIKEFQRESLDYLSTLAERQNISHVDRLNNENPTKMGLKF